MYSMFVLISVVAVAVSAVTEEECKKMGHPKAMQCCKSVKADPEKFTELKECFKGDKRGDPGSPPPQPSCERDICIGKKMGYSDDEGNMDKAAFEKAMGEKVKTTANDAALDFMKRECIDGNTDDYGPHDACDLAKATHCVMTGMLMTCTEFDESKPHCADIKKKVGECKSVL